MDKNYLSPEKITQIKDILKEINITDLNQSIVQDNKLIFPFKAGVYRVHMPNQMEQTEAENHQNEYKIRIIQEGKTISRQQLIRELKEKQNVDIVALEKKKEGLRKQLQDVYLDLAVVDSAELEKIEELRNKKNKIESDFTDLLIEITEWLTPCIQEKAKIEYYRYLAYICTEKQVDTDTFQPVWQSYEEFGKDKTGLTYRAIDNVQSLLLNIKE